MIEKKTTVRASCHCGSVQLDVFLSNGLEEIIRCNCSICSRGKGFAMVCVLSKDVKVIDGEASITEYIFNTAAAPHFFCIVCGIHTHHRSRSRPDRSCINVSCIEGLNLEDYNEVISFDGINHPSDV
ncbi:MAG: hypothetical protein ACI8Y9_001085 [Paracoccaceae bacterium]|jgi:hypothetical protein